VRSPGRNIGYCRGEQRRIDVADGARAWLISRSAQGHRDAEIGVAGLQLSNLFAEDEIVWCLKAKNQVDPAWPKSFREIARHTYHGCDTHAAADQDDAFRFFPGEAESSIGSFDLNLITDPELVV
jgi:hypothetical protein